MMPEDQCVKDFAVHILGCGCPDAVFETIARTRFIVAIADVYAVDKIVIGNRLLLYIAAVSGNGDQEQLIAALLERGVQERESQGYNRLRLVFYGENEQQESNLSFFNSLAMQDERAFCHFVKTEDIAKVLFS